MSTVSEKDVKTVAKLSALKLSAPEIKKFSSQLSSVVDYISELSEIDTDGVEPTSQTTGLTNVYRKDEISPSRTLSNNEALLNAKKFHNGYFLVPPVLEKDKNNG